VFFEIRTGKNAPLLAACSNLDLLSCTSSPCEKMALCLYCRAQADWYAFTPVVGVVTPALP